MAEEYVQKRAFEEYGLISYCGSVESLLPWSHYADSHKGIALGFDYNGGVFNQTLPCFEWWSRSFVRLSQKPRES